MARTGNRLQNNGDNDMMTLNTAVGILVFLVGMTLTASIAVNLHTQRLLRQCREMLNFCFFIAAREDERRTLESISCEGTE